MKPSLVSTEEEWKTWVRTLAQSTNPRDFELLVAKLKVLLTQTRREALQEAIDSLPKPYLEVGVNPEGLHHKQLHNHALELCRANIAALLDKE